MKRLAMTVVLMCALSGSIFAGNMPTTGVVEQPPQPTTTSSTSSTLLVNAVLTIISLI